MEATEVVEVIKSLIRPVIILSSWTTWLWMVIVGMTVPSALAGIVAAITAEYVVERAVKRFRNQ